MQTHLSSLVSFVQPINLSPSSTVYLNATTNQMFASLLFKDSDMTWARTVTKSFMDPLRHYLPLSLVLTSRPIKKHSNSWSKALVTKMYLMAQWFIASIIHWAVLGSNLIWNLLDGVGYPSFHRSIKFQSRSYKLRKPESFEMNYFVKSFSASTHHAHTH